MAILFGFADDDIEPINWQERLDLVDEALWVPQGLAEALVFFDPWKLDLVDPGTAIEALVGAIADLGAVRLERWGYLPAGDDETRRSIAKLEEDWCASPLLRYRYGRGGLVVAVFSTAPSFDSEVERYLDRHPACLDVVIFRGEGRASRLFHPITESG